MDLLGIPSWKEAVMGTVCSDGPLRAEGGTLGRWLSHLGRSGGSPSD